MKNPDMTSEVRETKTSDHHRKLRRSLIQRALVGVVVLLVFVIMIFVLVVLRQYSPSSKYDLTHGTHGASESKPGYGFDLSTGYGTAAIRHRNGSMTHIGNVSASPAYVEMMRRLSKKGTSMTGTKDYSCYPYTWAAFSDIYRWPYFWRVFRKGIGLPATADVALLADLLKSLHKKQAQQSPGSAAKSVVVTFPNHWSLCQEDITDALEYLGISPLTSRQLHDQPHQMSAAYAGYGMGLCQKPTDLSVCRAEEKNMSTNMTLAISLTKDALMVETCTFTTAIRWSSPNSYIEHPVDYELGLDALSKFPDPISFWARVHETIRWQALREIHFRNHIDTIILYGEAASSTKFQSVVKEVVESLQDDVPIFSAEPEFVAARGAAELAQRTQLDLCSTKQIAQQHERNSLE